MSRIAVFGGANLDIFARTSSKINMYDSNPGIITTAFGGVGRNIAEICAALWEDVWFVSCFSDDVFGSILQEDCRKKGMDTSASAVIAGVPTSKYLAFMDEGNDMSFALNDMRLLDYMDEKVLKPALNSLSKNDIIIIDANLKEESILYIVHNSKCRVAADPVSAVKAPRFIQSLNNISIFKPNRFEAMQMNGIEIKDEESARQSLDWFLERGVQEILISLSQDGLLVGSAQGRYRYTHEKADVDNATGGGDTLLASYVVARQKGLAIDDAARYGIGAAVTMIEQDPGQGRVLDHQKIEERMKRLKIEGTVL